MSAITASDHTHHLNEPPLHIVAISRVPSRKREEIIPVRESDYSCVKRVVYDNVPFYVGFDLQYPDNNPASRREYVCSGILLKLDEKLVDVGHVMTNAVLDAVEKLGREVLQDEEHERIVASLDL